MPSQDIPFPVDRAVLLTVGVLTRANIVSRNAAVFG